MKILNDALNYKFDLLDKEKIYEYILNDYVIISSTYENLNKCYKLIKDFIPLTKDNKIINTKIGKITVQKNDKMVLIENIDSNFVNGDEVIINEIIDNNKITIKKDNEIIIVDSLKVLPINFITCHKSQGRTINNVIIILDDLFEITRAKKDVKFILFDKMQDKIEIDAF